MPEHHHHHHHHHWRDRNGYAHRAGQPGPGPNFHRLRRSTRKAKIAGVCAGLASYFGWRLKWVRLAFILASVVPPFAPIGLVIYGVLAIFLKTEEQAGFYAADSEHPSSAAAAEEERFWRTFSIRPKQTFSELKHRFRALEARIGDLEHAVTSDEYGLRKAFRDLERGA